MRSESVIQQEIIQILRYFEFGLYAEFPKIPELGLIFHVPNEGSRSFYTASKLKNEGLRAGVSDLCLPMRSHDGRFGCLFIEMKRSNGGVISKAQKDWIAKVKRFGNEAILSNDSRDCVKKIMEYLGYGECVKMIESSSGWNRIKNPTL